MSATEGQLLWEPPDELRERSRMADYMRWLAEHEGLQFSDYDALWRWSIADLEAFWGSVWRYFGVESSHPWERVLGERGMPGADWFPGAELSFVGNIFRNAVPGKPAIVFRSETVGLREITWNELRRSVGSVAAGLRSLGVGSGDRVVSYMPNIPETVIAFLATSSLGAIWSSCSPDFGARSVVDRFQQIEPKVLFAVDGYRYGGADFDRVAIVAELQRSLPTLERTVMVAGLGTSPNLSRLGNVLHWQDLVAEDAELEPVELPFSHPLWVAYTSGTTGLPKPIVHSQGGVLLELLKGLGLQLDLGPSDTLFWFTTTGWVMWNIVVGGLLTGATIVLYDGNPAEPNLGSLWDLAQDSGVTIFGCSAAFVTTCMKGGMRPGAEYDLSKVRVVASTGSPLSPEAFEWVYQNVKQDVWLASISGGTDICSAFVGACALLPVYAGESQCRYLGVNAQAYDSQGRALIDQVGELVITEPMPSMPVYFWNDAGDRRYLESYFETYPGVWRHGDWVKITPRGSVVVYGRSDSTINRQGVRIGTSEIYRVVETLSEIADSLVVDLEEPGGLPYMPLFVVVAAGVELDDALQSRIKAAIRSQCSPRHVPNEIIAVRDVPRTLNGKKMEVPVKRIFQGQDPGKVVSVDSMSNPESLSEYVELAARRAGQLTAG